MNMTANLTCCWSRILLRGVILPHHSIPCKINYFHTTSVHPNKSKAVSKIVNNERLKSKAREATTTTWYSFIVLGGIGITGFIGYNIYKEFFGSFSCQSIYSDASKIVVGNEDVQNLLGMDLMCYGEESRRGRRTHVRHTYYEVDGGVRGLRMQFHVKGGASVATVSLDARETSTGVDYIYLYVQQDHYPHRIIVLKDQRTKYYPQGRFK